ncbi:MAG TPA: LacI family DNA-binding transcriptional regulator [Gaiellaceae bacterium]|jgi:LacI family transcriptional regulator
MAPRGDDEQRPRLRDVANAAGVDPSIASRILSGDGALTVRPETRRRVLEAASRLSYRPNTAARALKTRRTMAIGMIVPDLTNVAYATVALGADERASRAGYALLVATGSVRDRLDAIEGRIDGLLVGIATSETIRILELGGRLPTVLVNRRELLGIPSVTVDDEAGAALATEHLLSLGHRHIGHVAGPQNSDTGRRRLAGYVAAMRAARIDPGTEWVLEASYDEAGGELAATRLLRVSPRPTALFVANVRAAIGALAAARRLGLSVPADVSLVGFHDAPVAMYLEPELTTVKMPLREMGGAAIESLLALVDGQTVEDVRVATPPELVVRGSTAPPTV